MDVVRTATADLLEVCQHTEARLARLVEYVTAANCLAPPMLYGDESRTRARSDDARSS